MARRSPKARTYKRDELIAALQHVGVASESEARALLEDYEAGYEYCLVECWSRAPITTWLRMAERAIENDWV